MNYFNYYTEIEDAFVRRRGKHLLLSPLDWALIESWQVRGVPLHVALRGIERAFDSHDAKPRRRSVKSLMYCQEEVEAQFAEWLDSRLGASAQAATGDGDENSASSNGKGATRGDNEGLPFPRAVILAHLNAVRASLDQVLETRAQGSPPDELGEALARTASRLEELLRDFAEAARPNAEQLENSLTDLEELLDRAIRACALPAQLAMHRAKAEEQLRSYRNRMERATYEQTLNNLLAKMLREEYGIPRLSLFYL